MSSYSLSLGYGKISVHICVNNYESVFKTIEKKLAGFGKTGGNFSINQSNLALGNGENSLITFDAVAHWLQK